LPRSLLESVFAICLQGEGFINYREPPRLSDHKGEKRQVGFELEFTGLTLEQTTKQLLLTLEGTEVSRTEASIKIDTGLGKFTVELDWDYLKKEAENPDDNNYLSMLRDAASLIVPIEVVCPPIDIDKLAQLDPMVQALYDAGARGTDDSLIAAYGVHINPSLPALDAATLDAYLRAFALLQWWLVRANRIDLSRRITPYIDLYPEKYLLKLLATESPDQATIIDTYLEFNATRNRALDMLPLFSYLDQSRVEAKIDDSRIKSRPTFHYRLPNSLIGSADWNLAESWNLWCVVEELADRPQDLRALSEDFIEARRPLLGVDHDFWVDKIERWLHKVALV